MEVFLVLVVCWLLWGVGSYFTRLYAKRHGLIEEHEYATKEGTREIIWFDPNNHPNFGIFAFLFLTPRGIFLGFIFPIIGMFVS
jgi:hypothetical protein